jgi:tetratricopeptide (TPR) repeat protein
MRKLIAFIFSLALAAIAIVPLAARAVDASSQQHLQACLKRADDLPDIAAAEAESWFKKGGGDAARLCRATAQFNRGEFDQSAQDFTSLAGGKGNARRVSLLYQQAGLAFMRAAEYKKSDEAYGKALKLESQDPDIWIDRATERAAAQRYWDAVADLNQALVIMPDMPEALRLRGQVWFKLGFGNNAQDDFGRAEEIEEADGAMNAKVQPVAAKTGP